MPHLLFVCHGNVARSPAAEVVARARLGADSDWTVASAGVGALVGRPVADDVAHALSEHGLDARGHAARQVDAAALAGADLVLCMERAQREWLVDESPRDARRALVFGQARRLAATAPRHVAGLEHLLLDRQPAAADDDVPDPYRRGLAPARETVALLRDGLEEILALLVPGRAVRHEVARAGTSGQADAPGQDATPRVTVHDGPAHGLSTPRSG